MVPVADNKINFELSGAGKILGVGNGDPSCHEPDTFVAQPSMKTIPVNDWRWKLADVSAKGALVPEYANDLDDSAWNVIKPKTDGDTGDQVLSEGADGRFPRACQPDGGRPRQSGGADPVRRDRRSRLDFRQQPSRRRIAPTGRRNRPLTSRKSLHAGDNVIAVGVLNESGSGGLNPDVNVELIGKPAVSGMVAQRVQRPRAGHGAIHEGAG